MVKEKEYLMKQLKDAGIKSQVYTSMKKLERANEPHLAAILTNGDTFSRSGSKKIFVDQEGQRKRRAKLWDRITVLRVIIADTDEEKVETILHSFLLSVGKGMEIDGNWVNIDIGEADWVEEGDSILKAKIAVQFDVTFEGGIYVDTAMKQVQIGSIESEE